MRRDEHDESMSSSEDEGLERRVEKLAKINAVLMDRVERSMDQQGNAFEAIIARSGNHATGPRDLRTFARIAEPADATSNGVGFRCARPLQ